MIRPSTRLCVSLRQFERDVVNVVFPRGCAGCGDPDAVLCPDCAGLFTLRLTQPLPQTLIETGRVVSCAAYAGRVRQAILQWKDHGDYEVGEALASRLADVMQWAVMQPWAARCRETTVSAAAAAARGSGDDVRRLAVIPVPSSKASRAVRGRLQTAELAVALARRLNACGIPACAAECLAMAGKKKSVQASSVRRRQQRSVSGIRVLPRRFPSDCAAAVLVDDICTTGSTLLGCARTLHAQGIRVAAAFTIASVLR